MPHDLRKSAEKEKSAKKEKNEDTVTDKRPSLPTVNCSGVRLQCNNGVRHQGNLKEPD